MVRPQDHFCFVRDYKVTVISGRQFLPVNHSDINGKTDDKRVGFPTAEYVSAISGRRGL